MKDFLKSQVRERVKQVTQKWIDELDQGKIEEVIRSQLDSKLEEVIRSMLGVDDFGRLAKTPPEDSPLYKKLKQLANDAFEVWSKEARTRLKTAKTLFTKEDYRRLEQGIKEEVSRKVYRQLESFELIEANAVVADILHEIERTSEEINK